MAYVTLADVRVYLGVMNTDDDALLTILIAQAQNDIETSICHRHFEAVTETRCFNSDCVDGQDLLLDEDLLTITTLTNGDGDTLASDTYTLRPRNQTPYHTIRLKSGYSWDFTDSDSEISVAGTWGWSTTAPGVVEQAMYRLVAYYYRIKDSHTFEVIAYPEAGVISIPQGVPVDVERMLRPFIKRTLAGV